MSLDLNVFCERKDKLLAAHPELQPEDVSCGYLGEIADLLAGPARNDRFLGEYEHPFEMLDIEYDLDDVFFDDLIGDGRVKVSGKKAARYLRSLLDLLAKRERELPSVYWFEEDRDGEPNRSTECLVNGVRLQAGFDHCVLIEEDTDSVRDLRGEHAIDCGARHFTIGKASLLKSAGTEFAAMLRVAETAQHRDVKLVLELT